MDREGKTNLHKEYLDRLHELYIAKNSKYGMTSFLVRVEDKLNRVHSLISKGSQEVLDEKLEDTLLDAANYLILAAIELRYKD